jgi:hypothetical protein
MTIFGPNVFVDGTLISRTSKTPNSEADRKRYENAVIAVRDRLQQTSFGAKMLELLSNPLETIVIAQSRSLTNASAEIVKNDGSGFAAGFPLVNRQGQSVGTGTGTPALSVLKFDPAIKNPDTALIHELLHAFRQASGRWNPLPMASFVNPALIKNPLTEQRLFNDWEEWFSVLAEGIYGAESGRTSVRVAHSPDFPLLVATPSVGSKKNALHPDAQTDSEIFAERYGLAIRRLLNEEEKVFWLMYDSPTWFNPVLDWSKQQAGY